MKGAVLALFCAVALVSAELNENGCPINPYVDVLKAHPNCNMFYQCRQGELFERYCAADLVFNEEAQACDYAENVACGSRPVAPDSSKESGNDSNANGDSNESGGSNNGGGNGNPDEAADICAAEGSNGVLVAHENCNQFYKCSDGKPVALNCPSNLKYNIETEQCDWPENVNCGGRNEDNGNGGDGNGDNEDTESENNGGGNGNPDEANDICAAEGSSGVLVAHENCNQFYKCSKGVPVAMECPLNLLYNYVKEQCDWPENVNCEGRNEGGDSGNGDENKSEGDAETEDSSNEDGDNEDAGDGEEDKDNGNVGGGNWNPSEAPQICAREDSDSILIAHENCNQYYVCKDGLPVALHCNPNLYFNPDTDACDWPNKVDCSTRRTFMSFNKHLL